MKYEINPTLLKMAQFGIDGEKKAFMPPEAMDPAMGGMGGGMPMDPGMGGGMPMDPSMGGMPPMDPMMGGGMPMDPSMGGGMPPEAMPPAPPPAPAPAPPGTPVDPATMQPKKPKIEPQAIYDELKFMRNLMTTMFKNLGWNMPDNILDGHGEPPPEAVPPAEPGPDAAPAPPAAPPAAPEMVSADQAALQAPKMAFDKEPTIAAMNTNIAATAALCRQLNGH